MTNHELTSAWTMQETTAFEKALERRKMRQRKATSESGAPQTEEHAASTSTPDADVSGPVMQSGGMMIRIAGMAVGVVALAAIAAFGLAV